MDHEMHELEMYSFAYLCKEEKSPKAFAELCTVSSQAKTRYQIALKNFHQN